MTLPHPIDERHKRSRVRFDLVVRRIQRRNCSIGIAQSHISAIEHGQGEIGALILLRIARHYGKSIEWLLTGRDAKAL
jgi:transcriptional regulator with XRE-family HTH domain